MRATFKGIRGGDKVTYRTPQGQERTGSANPLLCFPSHIVINTGGRYGTPQVVNEANYIKHHSRHSTPKS